MGKRMGKIQNLPAGRAISSEMLAKVYGKQNAMAAEVQILMGNVQRVHVIADRWANAQSH